MGKDRDRYWCEVTVSTPPDISETVADFLFGITGRGVSISESEDMMHTCAYLEAEESEDQTLRIQAYLDSLASMGVISADTAVTTRQIPEEDWLDVFRSQHSTVTISERLTVRPTWCEPGTDNDIVLDPGMAFGTGSHSTTRMCLELLDDAIGDDPQDRMLDVGTGSGILAISAAYLGVGEILAVDIDAMSVKTASDNVFSNSVEQMVTVQEGSIGDAESLFDIITANLSASLLNRMAPKLAAHIEPEGILIASGAMLGEKDVLLDAFSAAGLELREGLDDDTWFAGVFVLSKQ